MSDENYYDIYLRMWKQLDTLWEEGKENSQEADDLRDAMDFPWSMLTREQIEEIEGSTWQN